MLHSAVIPTSAMRSRGKATRSDEISFLAIEGMMEPETSVSALVFNHLDCANLSAGE